MHSSSNRTLFQGNLMEAYLQMATNFPNILSTDLRPIKGAKLAPGAGFYAVFTKL